MIIFLISHRNHVVVPRLNCLVETVQMRGHNLCYTYRIVSRVFRIPIRGGIAPEKSILNMSDIILYVFCIMAANQLCLF